METCMLVKVCYQLPILILFQLYSLIALKYSFSFLFIMLFVQVHCSDWWCYNSCGGCEWQHSFVINISICYIYTLLICWLLPLKYLWILLCDVICGVHLALYLRVLLCAVISGVHAYAMWQYIYHITQQDADTLHTKTLHIIKKTGGTEKFLFFLVMAHSRVIEWIAYEHTV